MFSVSFSLPKNRVSPLGCEGKFEAWARLFTHKNNCGTNVAWAGQALAQWFLRNHSKISFVNEIMVFS